MVTNQWKTNIHGSYVQRTEEIARPPGAKETRCPREKGARNNYFSLSPPSLFPSCVRFSGLSGRLHHCYDGQMAKISICTSDDTAPRAPPDLQYISIELIQYIIISLCSNQNCSKEVWFLQLKSDYGCIQTDSRWVAKQKKKKKLNLALFFFFLQHHSARQCTDVSNICGHTCLVEYTVEGTVWHCCILFTSKLSRRRRNIAAVIPFQSCNIQPHRRGWGAQYHKIWFQSDTKQYQAQNHSYQYQHFYYKAIWCTAM